MASSVTIGNIFNEDDWDDDGKRFQTVQVEFNLSSEDTHSDWIFVSGDISFKTSLDHPVNAVTLGRKLNDCYEIMKNLLHEWADDAELMHRQQDTPKGPRPRKH